MKIVIIWLSLVLGVGVVATSATSCSVSHRSDAFACSVQADCNQGRRCVDGYCIDPNATIDASQIDGPIDRPDARLPIDSPQITPDAPPQICPNGCTSCNFADHVCIVDCSAPNAACGAQVKCPPTWNCDIQCNTYGSCRNGVTCAAGVDCNIACTGTNSCRNLTCGSGACDVECSGNQSCRNVNCGSACACEVNCPGQYACYDGIACSQTLCETDDGGCSAAGLCDTCQ